MRKVKQKMKLGEDLRGTRIRGTKNEILIDMDGDGLPDVALMDSTGDVTWIRWQSI